MKNSCIIFFIAAVIGFILVGTQSHAIKSGRPTVYSYPTGYIELVRRKDSCPERDCFAEYFFLSNGVIVRKQFSTNDYEGRPEISIRQTAPESVQKLQEKALSFIQSHSSTQKWNVDRDKIYISTLGRILTYSNNESAEFSEILAEAQNIFLNSPTLTDRYFFLHSYYQKTNGDISDFHVFEYGAFVFSEFKRKSDELKSSTVGHFNLDDFVALRNLSKTAIDEGIRPVPYRKCDTKSKLDYSFVEMMLNGNYVKTYLCPDSPSPFSSTFEFLRTREPQQ